MLLLVHLGCFLPFSSFRFPARRRLPPRRPLGRRGSLRRLAFCVLCGVVLFFVFCGVCCSGTVLSLTIFDFVGGRGGNDARDGSERAWEASTPACTSLHVAPHRTNNLRIVRAYRATTPQVDATPRVQTIQHGRGLSRSLLDRTSALKRR